MALVGPTLVGPTISVAPPPLRLSYTMVSTTGVFLVMMKLFPLGIYVRSAACKLAIPVLGCDEPLCPVAIGQPAVNEDWPNGCTPTANTLEQKAWCEHGWSPWMNTLVAKAGTLHPTIATFTAQIPTITCNEENGFIVMKVLASIEIVAYVLLWLKPASGAFLLTVFMSFALHFHLVFLKDPIKALALQLVLVCASFIVWALEVQVADAVSAKAVKPPPPVKVDRSKAPFGKGKKAAKAD